jgi:hypothetical protein
VRKDFAEETRSDALGRGFEEGACQQPAWKARIPHKVWFSTLQLPGGS